MNIESINIFFYGGVIIMFILIFCILYLIIIYKRLLDKYVITEAKNSNKEFNENVKFEVDSLTKEKINSSIDKATLEAVDLISKNAKNVTADIREKTLEKLLQEKKSEEAAVASEFEAAKVEIQKYKEQEFEKIKAKANEVLQKVTDEVLPELINKDLQENLIIKSIENAKRNIF